MALTQTESNALMNNFDFRGRIKVCALKYAKYIYDEATNVPAHNTRSKWARETGQNPEQAAMTLHPLVVMDTAVQDQGDAIDDPGLQSAVENTVNSFF